MRHKTNHNCSTIYIVRIVVVVIANKWINSIRVSSWIIRVNFWPVVTYLNHFNKTKKKKNKQNKQTNKKKEMSRRLNIRFHFKLGYLAFAKFSWCRQGGSFEWQYLPMAVFAQYFTYRARRPNIC